MKYLFISLFIILTSLCVNAQDAPLEGQGKKIFLSANTGFPSLVGINLEYLLPTKNNRISIQSDLGYFPFISADVNTAAFYYSLGANMYLKNTGKGFYLGVDFGGLPIKTTKIDGDKVDLQSNFSALNSKIGLKFGKTSFLKLELGYSLIFYDLEDINKHLRRTYGIQINPEIDFLHLPNIKVGFAFPL